MDNTEDAVNRPREKSKKMLKNQNNFMKTFDKTSKQITIIDMKIFIEMNTATNYVYL
jgi:hypothetical protein